MSRKRPTKGTKRHFESVFAKNARIRTILDHTTFTRLHISPSGHFKEELPHELPSKLRDVHLRPYEPLPDPPHDKLLEVQLDDEPTESAFDTEELNEQHTQVRQLYISSSRYLTQHSDRPAVR
jgi:hypothetical protein